MNVLHLTQRVNLGVSQEAWSDDSYDLIPFTCNCRLDKDELWGRLSHAIYKRFPPRHHGGCGYSCSVHKILRDFPDNGYVIIRHYHGIGD